MTPPPDSGRARHRRRQRERRRRRLRFSFYRQQRALWRKHPWLHRFCLLLLPAGLTVFCVMMFTGQLTLWIVMAFVLALVVWIFGMGGGIRFEDVPPRVPTNVDQNAIGAALVHHQLGHFGGPSTGSR